MTYIGTIIILILQHGPKSLPDIDAAQLLEDVERALWATKLVSYAQALSLIADVDPAAVAHCLRVWQAGTPLRSRLLSKVRSSKILLCYYRTNMTRLLTYFIPMIMML